MFGEQTFAQLRTGFTSELRSCVKVEVAVLGSPLVNMVL